MSNISNKISSIEPAESKSGASLGLHPLTEEEPLALSEPIDPGEPVDPDPVPGFITRNRHSELLEVPTKSPMSMWLIMFVAALFWIIASLVLLNLMTGLDTVWTDANPVELAALALFTIGPACLVAATVYAVHKLSAALPLAAQLERTNRQMLTPDASAGQRTADLSAAIRREIQAVNRDIDNALSKADGLGETLSVHRTNLQDNVKATAAETDAITTRLASEREALTSISELFEQRMDALSQLIQDHSQALERSAESAEEKIKTVRDEIETTADKINEASDSLRSNSLEAASSLSTNQSELSQLNDGLADHVAGLETMFKRHADKLNAVIGQLRDDQNAMTASLDSRIEKLKSVSLEAAVSEAEPASGFKQVSGEEKEAPEPVSKPALEMDMREMLRGPKDDFFDIPGPSIAPENQKKIEPEYELEIEAPDLELEPVIPVDEDVRDVAPNPIFEPEQELEAEPDPEPQSEILKRTVPDIRKPDTRTGDGKPWWKSLIPGRDDDAESMALGRMNPSTRAHEGEVIMRLAELGLAPGAVITDGCIQEAVDIRIQSGANSMSRVVANRVGDPIDHLKSSLSESPELAQQMSQFAARFHTSLQDAEGDAENLRNRFAKDDGRAFLICDAALNT